MQAFRTHPLLLRIAAFLQAKPSVGGMEISDTALRFILAPAGGIKTWSVRLAPGILEGGRIKDEAAFKEALRSLRAAVLGKKSSSSLKISVVATLSSANVYSQVFDLPYLEGEALEKSVDLNIKMASPSANAYSGWQIVGGGRDRSRLAILAAFLEEDVSDTLTEALRSSGFAPVAIEPKALALARLARLAIAGSNGRDPRIIVAADADGLDIFIMREGELHFDYFNSWKDIQGGGKSISIEDFRNVVTRNFSQVLHYYSAHFKEPLAEVLVVATGMKDEIIERVREISGQKVREFTTLISPPPTPEWFVALGAAFRGRQPRKDDKEASVLGVNAQETYRREEIEHFLGFWRIMAPAALGFMLLVFFGARLLLARVNASIESEELFQIGREQAKEIEALRDQAAAFNRSVEFLKLATGATRPISPTLQTITDIASRRSIDISRLSINGSGTPVILVGSAGSESDIRDFKNELSLTKGITEVNLPFTEIRKAGDAYTFSISFLASF